MTAAVMYWVESGRLECIGAFGNKPGLKARGGNRKATMKLHII